MEVVEHTPNRFLITSYKLLSVNRINLLEHIDKEGRGISNFIGCKNHILTENIMMNVIESLVGTKKVDLITFQPKNGYWNFDVKDLLNRLEHIRDIKSRLNIDIINNRLGNKIPEAEKLVVYKPNLYIRKRRNHRIAVNEFEKFSKNYNQTIYVDSKMPPASISDSVNCFWIEKDKDHLKIKEFLKGKKIEKKLYLYGQTSLNMFHEKVSA